MLEHTKKRYTKQTVEARFSGPSSAIAKLRETAKELGVVDLSESIPWREAFPEYADKIPGTVLRGSRYKEGLTQKGLAAITGIPQQHISEMEHGKRTIGKESAKKFARVFQCDYRVFL